jgi:hypothetical protein
MIFCKKLIQIEKNHDSLIYKLPLTNGINEQILYTFKK